MDDAVTGASGPGFPDDGVPGTWVRGRTFILVVVAVMILVVAVNVFAARRNNDARARRVEADRIVHDPARTLQSWRTTSEGMVVTMRPVRTGDRSTTEAIRRHLAHMRGQYLRASYDDSAHPNGAPGSADLEFATSHEQLNVRYLETADGGSLRWVLWGDAATDRDTRCVVAQSLREWGRAVATSPVVDAAPLTGC